MSRRKKVRMKRHHLKRFSSTVINTGGYRVDGASPLRMFGTQREMTADEIAYRHRRDLWIDKRMMDVFGEVIDRPRWHTPKDQPTKPWKAVQDALARLNQESTQMWEDRDATQRRVTLRDTELWKVEMVWSKDSKRFILLEFDGIEGFVRESIRYTSRDRAIQVFNNKEVSWKFVTPIPAI